MHGAIKLRCFTVSTSSYWYFSYDSALAVGRNRANLKIEPKREGRKQPPRYWGFFFLFGEVPFVKSTRAARRV